VKVGKMKDSALSGIKHSPELICCWFVTVLPKYL